MLMCRYQIEGHYVRVSGKTDGPCWKERDEFTRWGRRAQPSDRCGLVRLHGSRIVLDTGVTVKEQRQVFHTEFGFHSYGIK